jgi:hypothetical protein
VTGVDGTSRVRALGARRRPEQHSRGTECRDCAFQAAAHPYLKMPSSSWKTFTVAVFGCLTIGGVMRVMVCSWLQVR